MSEIQTVHVAVSGTSFSFDQLFTYRIPLHLQGEDLTGRRIVVPFGRNNSKRIGLVLDMHKKDADDAAKHNIKPILAVCDEKAVLNKEMLELVLWLSENTFCTFFEAVQAILPGGLHIRIDEQYCLSENYDESQLSEEEKNFIVFLKNASAPSEFDKLVKNNVNSDKTKKKLLKSLMDKNVICLKCNLKQKTKEKSAKMIRLTSEYLEEPDRFSLTPKQKKIADILSGDISYALSEICYICGVTAAVPNAMYKNGVVEIYEKRVMRDIEDAEETENIDDLVLTEQQQNAFDRVSSAMTGEKASCFLLHGVTGSGKTSVFKKLIEKCVSDGRQVLYLLPEISLTPQILGQFRNLFGNIVTVIHSGLSLGQRLDAFERVKSGDAKIVIGTRSAVFAPAENIGLIIMDEEGERSYKSESSPRYNTIDVAKYRVRYHNAVLLLASATPSIESYYLARKGVYELIEMDKRYSGLSLPDVRIVDMNREESYGIDLKFSETLINEVNENIRRYEQTILLLNRRGYHTMMSCVSCGQPVFCSNCSVPMTYHKKNNKLMCHYCGEIAEIPTVCPSCGAKTLHMTGSGTQRLEEQVQNIFPKARILRMDADTVFSRDSYEKNIKDFEEGKYDILVGTQMVGKGLNFPDVTLVGVVSTDKSLYMGDFRSYERTFSLIAQVVGRGGRGEKKGRAILQTCVPDHYVIKLAAKQDYKSFYKEEIIERKRMLYPPICDLCIIGLSGENEEKVKRASEVLMNYIKNKLISENRGHTMPVRLLGPCEAAFGKINKKYRYRIIIKCKNTPLMRDFIRDVLKKGTASKDFGGISVYADMNGDAGI